VVKKLGKAKNKSKAYLNMETYLKPPTAAQVIEFVDELEVTMTQFERFFGMPYGTIRQAKGDFQPLPAKFWHIVYEKIKPAYGVGYFNPDQTPGKKKKAKVATTVPHENDNSALLDKLKDNLK
jgi:hypothetical protein